MRSCLLPDAIASGPRRDCVSSRVHSCIAPRALRDIGFEASDLISKGLTNIHLLWCKICTSLIFNITHRIEVEICKALCVKTQKIKNFLRGNYNKCKKSRTFVPEYVSYTIREVKTNRDTKPLSSKNVRQLGQLMC